VFGKGDAQWLRVHFLNNCFTFWGTQLSLVGTLSLDDYRGSIFSYKIYVLLNMEIVLSWKLNLRVA
ncbi:hypothetical protein ACQP3L_38370, partial [Escherichia coli]